jgi:membrane protein DedA with SNARE-associated domain
LAKFTIFTVIGCAVWCTALCSLGYSLGSSYNHVLNAFSFAGYVIGALAVVAVVVVFWHRLHAYRRQRDEGRAQTEV